MKLPLLLSLGLGLFAMQFGGGFGRQQYDYYSGANVPSEFYWSRLQYTSSYADGNSYGRRYGGGGGYRDSAASGPMVEGKVKFFNDQKGFGFVMPDSGSGDIYLHASALRRSGVQVVEPDQRIRYSTRQGNKGVEVDRVEII